MKKIKLLLLSVSLVYSCAYCYADITGYLYTGTYYPVGNVGISYKLVDYDWGCSQDWCDYYTSLIHTNKHESGNFMASGAGWTSEGIQFKAQGYNANDNELYLSANDSYKSKSSYQRIEACQEPNQENIKYFFTPYTQNWYPGYRVVPIYISADNDLPLLGPNQAYIGLQILPDDLDWDMSNWIEKHISETTPFNELFLAGAHDAGTTRQYSKAKSNSMTRCTACQDKDFNTLCMEGVRYFDLRIWNSDGSLYIHHDDTNFNKLEVYLQQVSDFIRQHDKEIIILDCQSIQTDDDEKVGSELPELMKNIFGDYIIRTDSGINVKSQLKDIWSQKGRLFVLADTNWLDNSGVDTHNLFWSRDEVLSSPYCGQQENYTDQKKYMDQYLDERNSGMYGTPLFVLQMQMTPSNIYYVMIYSVSTQSIENITARYMYRAVEWLIKRLNNYNDKPFIVMYDYCQEGLNKLIAIQNVKNTFTKQGPNNRSSLRQLFL